MRDKHHHAEASKGSRDLLTPLLATRQLPRGFPAPFTRHPPECSRHHALSCCFLAQPLPAASSCPTQHTQHLSAWKLQDRFSHSALSLPNFLSNCLSNLIFSPCPSLSDRFLSLSSTSQILSDSQGTSSHCLGSLSLYCTFNLPFPSPACSGLSQR